MTVSPSLLRHIERHLLKTGAWIGNIAGTTLTLEEFEAAIQGIADRHDHPISIATIPGGVLVTAAISDWNWNPALRTNTPSDGAA